jgi:hypothetical protein
MNRRIDAPDRDVSDFVPPNYHPANPTRAYTSTPGIPRRAASSSAGDLGPGSRIGASWVGGNLINGQARDKIVDKIKGLMTRKLQDLRAYTSKPGMPQ